MWVQLGFVFAVCRLSTENAMPVSIWVSLAAVGAAGQTRMQALTFFRRLFYPRISAQD